ncbi:Hypothetical predicted protein [Mytilus galloprovincialis]|uniref:Uncharacterized protein n=1 Tax=Mytilus galloprovincialis TaxID=29158 RepID=A0A8B6F2N8_MYTGA|nr:Hypothetical predicted protein [Mytilus galloprovincialis]
MEYSKLVVIIIFISLFVILFSLTRLRTIENNVERTKPITEKRTFKSISYYSTYLEDIHKTRLVCGQLCNTSRKGNPGIFFDKITAIINCEALFQNEYVDSSHGLEHAPRKIPSTLLNDYTMNGLIKVHAAYFNQPYLGSTARIPNWTKSLLKEYVARAKEGKLFGTYGISETNALRDGLKHAPGVIGGRVLVIGSEKPWVEACLLEIGAKSIVTLEYGRIKSEHDQITTMVPSEYRRMFLDKTLGLFDAVVSFSSIEHSGLGRYGDSLNPWGDLIVVARAWCVTKTNGSLLLGVLYDLNGDYITFNAHRCYGKKRYPYLTTNWNQHYLGKGLQRVHVFTK